jgi:hypothetical protein
MTESITLCPGSAPEVGGSLPGGIAALDDECAELMGTRRGWVSHRAFLVFVGYIGEEEGEFK